MRQPYLLAKQNETKKVYIGPYIDASCQVWFHLAKEFQATVKQIFSSETAWSNGAKLARKHLHLVPFVQQIWPQRAILFSDWLMLNKSSCLLAKWNQMKKLYRRSCIDASCQV
jgi:hypothetical protein